MIKTNRTTLHATDACIRTSFPAARADRPIQKITHMRLLTVKFKTADAKREIQGISCQTQQNGITSSLPRGLFTTCCQFKIISLLDNIPLHKVFPYQENPLPKMHFLIPSLLSLILNPQVLALQVYSCDVPSTAFEAIDLTEPGPCPDPVKDFNDPKTHHFQILATESEFPIKAHICKVIMSKKVTACSWIDSTTFASQYTLWEHSYEVSSTDCRQAINTGKLTVEGTEYSVKPGSELHKRFVSQGRIDNAGKCWGGHIISAGMIYPHSYEETILRITIETVNGAAHVDSGKAHFTNGVVAVTRDEFARDHSSFGVMVWVNNPPECKETVMTVYDGHADIHTRHGAKDKAGSVVMIANEEDEQYAALVLTNRIVICNSVCYGTTVKGLLACIIPLDSDPIPAKTVIRTDPIVKDFLSAMQNLHVRKSLKDNERFAQVQRDLCDTERKTISSKLQSLAGTANPYALLDVDSYNGKGYNVFVAGAVAYLTKCAPVEAVLASYDKCTNEIPVKLNNGNNSVIQFADPHTLVLSDYPTILPCNTINPVRWKIQGTWLCATPDVHPCMEPTMIKPTTGPFVPDLSSFSMMSGIFTHEQKEEYKIFRKSQEAVRPLQRAMAMTASGGSDSRGNLGLPINSNQISQLSAGFAEQYLPLIYRIGPLFTKAVSILIFISWTVAVLQGMWRLYVLITTRGVGWWLIAAFSNTLFTTVTMPSKIFFKAFEELKAQMKDIPNPRAPTRDVEAEQEQFPLKPYQHLQKTIVTIEGDNPAANGHTE